MNTTVTYQSEPIIVARNGNPMQRAQASSSLAEVLRALGISKSLPPDIASMRFFHRRIKPHTYVVRSGQWFDALYLVNSGFLKTTTSDTEGNECVLSFPMKGSVLGCDGICEDCYVADVVALTDCDLIVLPFKQLLAACHADAALEHVVHRVLSREIAGQQTHLATLSSLPADARVAWFLMMQAQQHAAIGFSPRSFILRTTRREIGSYLGLTLETVSRTLSALDAAGAVKVDQRSIQILRPDAL
jgi:CRP/FNR family transcriptional regulator, anaerobic regulatory protein